DQRPSVEYAVKNTAVTRSFDSWPPAGTRKARFYFGKGPTGSVASLNDGSLQSAPPAADGGSTTYAYPHARWVRGVVAVGPQGPDPDRKSTRLNSSHGSISYAVFCLKKKTLK